MSGEDRESAPVAGPPHSWPHLLSGLAVLMVAAVVCAALIAQYVASRPVNLTSLCAELAGTVESVLTTNQIPRSSIRTAPGELRQDDGARWCHYEFLVEVPEALSASGIATVLEKDMALRNVSTRRDGEAAGSPGTLSLAVGGREFASVCFAVTPGRTDLTAACARAAREVLALLDTAPPIWTKDNDQTLPREDEDNVWILRRVDAALAPGVRPVAIQNLIEQVMARREVYVPAEADETGERTILTVMLSGVPCLAMHLRHAEELPQVELPSLPALPQVPAHPESSVDAPATPADSSEGDEPRKQEGESGQAPPSGAKAAIIVDDGGQEEAVDAAFLALDSSLTLAILPGERFSAGTAARAADLGFEVMVHMPMESDTKRWVEPGQVYANMTPDEIRKCVEDAIGKVPGAVGMNNHTGSVFTSSKPAMKSLLTVLAEHGFYFIDSRTTADSVAFDTAQAMNVPSACRDVFLDNEADLAYIRGQCDQLAATAKDRGTAIGICHFRQTTADALREIIPEFEKAGVEIVHVSEVVQ